MMRQPWVSPFDLNCAFQTHGFRKEVGDLEKANKDSAPAVLRPSAHMQMRLPWPSRFAEKSLISAPGSVALSGQTCRWDEGRNTALPTPFLNPETVLLTAD